MSLDEIVPPGWGDIIRYGGHGNLMDQGKLRDHYPQALEWNRKLIEWECSTPGGEVAFLWDNSPLYNQPRIYQRAPKKAGPRPEDKYRLTTLYVPDCCDRPVATFKRLLFRPPTLDDFFECNERFEKDHECEENVRRRAEKFDAIADRKAAAIADKATGEAEDLIVDMQANPGRYAPRTVAGYSRAIEEAEKASAAKAAPPEPAPPAPPIPEEEKAPPLECGDLLEAALEMRTRKEVADALGVSVTTVKRWRSEGVPEARLHEVERALRYDAKYDEAELEAKARAFADKRQPAAAAAQ